MADRKEIKIPPVPTSAEAARLIGIAHADNFRGSIRKAIKEFGFQLRIVSRAFLRKRREDDLRAAGITADPGWPLAVCEHRDDGPDVIYLVRGLPEPRVMAALPYQLAVALWPDGDYEQAAAYARGWLELYGKDVSVEYRSGAQV